MVREYRLTYKTSPATARSLVSTIKECDALGVCLPATTFTYNGAKAASSSPYTIHTPVLLGGPSNRDWFQDLMRFDPSANLILGDYNGDGKTDCIRQEKSGLDNNTVNTFNVYMANGDKNIDSLKSVVNGLGGKVDVQYAPLTNSSVYTKGTNAPSGMTEVQSDMYVVESYQETPSTGAMSHPLLNFGGRSSILLYAASNVGATSFSGAASFSSLAS